MKEEERTLIDQFERADPITINRYKVCINPAKVVFKYQGDTEMNIFW